MTSHTDAPPPGSRPGRGWSWGWLILALGVVALIRVPLVLNARAHLDSDLAVDGLALLDAMDGHWRWHYPATPFIGSPPVLLSWLQAKIWGPGPMTLASGGVVAYGLIVLLTFLLNRRAFGDAAASWGLVPLAFASVGTVWLSGRVTGGHLLAVAWHAGAFILFWDALVKGRWWRSAALGLWCGLGLYVDSMFALTWVGLGVGWLAWAFSASPGSKRFGRGFVCLLAFGLAAGLGIAPRIVGGRVDPHDAYAGQLEPDTRIGHIGQNARILAADCLPRLIAGHRLPGLQSEPSPSKLAGGSRATRAGGIPWFSLSLTVFSLYLFARAMAGLFVGDANVEGGAKSPHPNPPPQGGRESDSRKASLAIRWGLLASTLAMVAGFLVNRTIDNSDNYRYLVFLLVPWSTGFGLMMARDASKRPHGVWVSGAVTVAFAGLMTVDSARWYDGFGWVVEGGRPARKVIHDPALAWLDEHPEVTSILGNYWDVYRLSFLTGGRVRGVPFPEYPDRFPEIKAALPGGRPRFVVVGPDGFGPRYGARAMVQGGREIGRAGGLSIVEWPTGVSP